MNQCKQDTFSLLLMLFVYNFILLLYPTMVKKDD